MITYKGGQFMEKEKKIRIAILIILAGLALLAVLFGRNLEQWAGKDRGSYRIKKETADDTAPAMDKQKIHNLSAQPDDNLQPLEGEELAGEEGSDLELKFTGYDENVAVYSWLAGEDWERFKKELSLYLEKKNLDVTTVRLHPDSQQVIGDYLRYLYLDVDYRTEYSDTLLIKAVCDTYTDTLRFSFEVQYGD